MTRQRKIGVQKRAGITLLEVLLALAILSITVISMMQAATRCLAVTKKSKHFDAARQTMDAGMLNNPLIATNDVAELDVRPVEYERDGYRFSRTLAALEEDEDMFVVTSRVTWRERGKERFLDISGYLYTTNHP